MGVQLGAARLGVLQVAPGDEVDAPEAGLGRDGGEHGGVGRSRRGSGPRPAPGTAGTGPRSSPMRSDYPYDLAPDPDPVDDREPGHDHQQDHRLDGHVHQRGGPR